jgi:hypothetical protein
MKTSVNITSKNKAKKKMRGRGSKTYSRNRKHACPRRTTTKQARGSVWSVHNKLKSDNKQEGGKVSQALSPLRLLLKSSAHPGRQNEHPANIAKTALSSSIP